MAVRKRFNAKERDLISTTRFVQWQDVTHWKDAEITGGVVPSSGVIVTDSDGWQYVEAVNAAPTTRTISKGAVIRISPGKIRARQGA